MSPYSILSVMKGISGSVLLEVFGWERTRGQACPHLAQEGLFRGFRRLGGAGFSRLGGLQAFCGNFRRAQPILFSEDGVWFGSSPAGCDSGGASVEIRCPRWCGRMLRRSAGVIEDVDVDQLDHGPVVVFPGVPCGDGLAVVGVEFPVAGLAPGTGGDYCSGHWRDSFWKEWGLVRETFVSALGQILCWSEFILGGELLGNGLADLLAAAGRVGSCSAEVAPVVGFLQKPAGWLGFRRVDFCDGPGFSSGTCGGRKNRKVIFGDGDAVSEKPLCSGKIRKVIFGDAAPFSENPGADGNSRK